VLLDVLIAPELITLRAAFEEAVGAGTSGDERQTGTRHVEDLKGKNPVFEAVAGNPRVVAAAQHVLKRPFRILQLGGRDPLPGFGQQGLHTDWLPRTSGQEFSVVTALWLLDAFTADNGATRVIPGSHVKPNLVPKSMQAPENHHKDERVIVAPAGCALVFNGHLWHSGTRNRSKSSRRVLQCQFVMTN
jgi:ectoine hydroxylase-related dioxygenase (phytanoyl-CoA dioxygenase family)